MRAFKFAVCVFVFMTFFSGCETLPQPSQTTETLASLKCRYKGASGDFKDDQTIVRGLVLEKPISCSGLAGEIGGFGAFLSVVSIELPDGTKVIGIVPTTEGFDKDNLISGQIIFVSAGALKKGWPYLPP